MIPTRAVASKVKDFTPHAYQARGVQFLKETARAALFWGMGLGKSVVTLTAFLDLQNEGRAHKMLVVAPIRVVQLTWAQEALKWSHTRHLRFATLHGPGKDKALRQDADVYLINPEGVPWLHAQMRGKRSPWDTVVLDELSLWRNSQAQRHKLLRPFAHAAQRTWGLTASPTPNGLMNLFGEFLMLDGGAALGKYISHFRDQYFRLGYDGFNYELQEGGQQRIEERIRPYVLRMSSEDYLELPPLTTNVIRLKMPKDVAAKYAALKKDMVLALPDGRISAANAAAVTGKLRQMAAGAVYYDDEAGARQTVHVHSLKLDALAELLDSMPDRQVLVGYEFQSDLQRLRERFGGDTPVLGDGVSAKAAAAISEAWNAGKTRLMFMHPASASHGLNLQGSGAGDIVWFSAPWNYEHYEQFIGRLHRQGTSASRIVSHVLCVEGTIDEAVMEALEAKGMSQARLLQALREEVGLANDEGENDMTMGFRRMPLQGATAPEPAPAAAPQAAAAPVVPKGWGVKAPAAQAPAEAPAAQAAPEPVAAEAAPRASGFSKAIQSRLSTPVAPEPAAPAPTEAASEPAVVEAATEQPKPKRAPKAAAAPKEDAPDPRADAPDPLLTFPENMAPTATVTVSFVGSDAAAVLRLIRAFH